MSLILALSSVFLAVCLWRTTLWANQLFRASSFTPQRASPQNSFTDEPSCATALASSFAPPVAPPIAPPVAPQRDLDLRADALHTPAFAYLPVLSGHPPEASAAPFSIHWEEQP